MKWQRGAWAALPYTIEVMLYWLKRNGYLSYLPVITLSLYFSLSAYNDNLIYEP